MVHPVRTVVGMGIWRRLNSTMPKAQLHAASSMQITLAGALEKAGDTAAHQGDDPGEAQRQSG